MSLKEEYLDIYNKFIDERKHRGSGVFIFICHLGISAAAREDVMEDVELQSKSYHSAFEPDNGYQSCKDLNNAKEIYLLLKHYSS